MRRVTSICTNAVLGFPVTISVETSSLYCQCYSNKVIYRTVRLAKWNRFIHDQHKTNYAEYVHVL